MTDGVTLLVAAAFFSYFFLLTLFEQQVLGYSPLRGGLSYVPFGLSIGLGIGAGTALMPRIGVKPLLTAGFAGCAVGLLLSSGIAVHGSYARSVLPGMLVLGLFSGVSFPACRHPADRRRRGDGRGGCAAGRVGRTVRRWWVRPAGA